MPPAKKTKKDDESKSEKSEEKELDKKEPDKEEPDQKDQETEPTVQTAPPSPPIRDTVTPGEDQPKRRPVQLAAPSKPGVISYTAPQSKPG